MSTTTEQRLADALREAHATLAAINKPDEYNTQSVQHMEDYAKGLRGSVAVAQRSIREALAAYDAQQVATPAPGKWVTGCCDRNDMVEIQVLSGCITAHSVGRVYKEHAAHIVQCVNAHDGLVSALQECADYLAEFMEEGREHRVIAQADDLLDRLGVIAPHQFEAFDTDRNDEPGEWCKHCNGEKGEHDNA